MVDRRLRIFRCPRWILLAVVNAGLLAVLGFHVLIDYSRHWDYNVVRLGRTFALAAGEPLYPPRDSGVLLNTIYGPVGALAYLPATALGSPVAAVLLSQLLSCLYVFAPVFWLHLRSSIPDPCREFLTVFGFLTFAAIAIDFQPLEYVSFSIHVDAPALGLALLACGVLMRPGGEDGPGPREGRRRFVLAAALAVLAVWTKLMTLPLLAALPAWVLLAEGRRRALDLAGTIVLAAAGISAVMVLLFGPIENLLLNMWTVPARQTLGDAADPTVWRRVVAHLVRDTWMVWLLWLAAVALQLSRRAAAEETAGESRRWIHDPVWSFGLVGLFMVPVMVMGSVKQGGDINTMAYVACFLLVGGSLSLARRAGRSAGVRRWLVATPTLVLLTVLTLQEPESLETLRHPFPDGSLPHQTAFEYASKHPGEVYFPRMTIVHLLTEGEVYHQGVGILDREYAGFPPTGEHLRAHLPPRMAGIAFHENMFSGEIYLFEELGYSRPVHEPELPGFVVWRKPYRPPRGNEGGEH